MITAHRSGDSRARPKNYPGPVTQDYTNSCQSESGWPGVATGLIPGASAPAAETLALFLRPQFVMADRGGQPQGWPAPGPVLLPLPDPSPHRSVARAATAPSPSRSLSS